MNKNTNSLGLYIACAMLLALTLPVVVALTVLNGTREKQISREMQTLVDEKSESLQHSLVLPVWSLDQAHMRALLQGAMLDSQVVSVEIRDPEEKIIIRQEEPLRRSGNLITRSVPLVMPQQERKLSLGSVQVVMSDAQLQQKLAADKRFQTLVLLAQAVVSLLIIGLLVYRRILAPIGKLTQATERIQHGHFDTRIVLPQHDEIGVLACHMDAMQTSLKALFDEQAAILRNIPAGVLFVRDGRIAFANGAAQTMLGWSTDQLEALPCAQIFQDPLQQAVYVTDKLAREQGAAGEIVLLKRGDGHSFPAELHCAMIDGASPGGQIWVIIDVSERLEAENRIDRLAFYDPVTELPNKTLFLDRLRRALVRQQSQGASIAVFYLEIHRADLSHGLVKADDADHLSKECARRLGACVSVDQTLARLDGEHFALGCEIRSEALADGIRFCEALAHRLTAALAEPQGVAVSFPYSLNIGINILRGQVQSAEEALMQAKLAMVQSLASGRNAFRFFDPAMQALASQRSALEVELREAVAQGQFVVYYQPQVTYEGQVVGAEALVRWMHPSKGMVSPAQFIAVAEQLGLMEEIGHLVLEAICCDLERWQRVGLAQDLVVAVNVSAQEFKVDHFVARFHETIRHHRLHSKAVKVELTESMMIEDVDEVIGKMNDLKSHAVSISLDDFGTGYSSLSYLGRFPIDQIKIDQSFVRQIQTDAATASIIRSIIMLGQSLGLSIIAEGVETEAQRDLLHAQGCTLYQGFWYGRPMPGEQFAALLQTPLPAS
ncbi:EAL domain-containing protein [uncultured Herbaspirillum sp.]|uniref:putative bifunctional diguanylate cyclase/phosphodiesterase n=1 Tax=uncultured Herbaspirillum sp. TaxID=160236 RepID=UPI002588251B|nr:EAL domain-containing protein [uncultured Herbaspirillum sp.]